MKSVKLYRVTKEYSGFVPRGYGEGQVIGFTDAEIATLQAQPPGLRMCFEPIEITPHNQGAKNAPVIGGDPASPSPDKGTEKLEAEHAAVEGAPEGDPKPDLVRD